ncbi:hypothetical protein ACFQJ8_18470 [Halocatena marina]
MHVVLKVIRALANLSSFGPRLSAVVADMYATNLDASNHALGCSWMYTETSDVGRVPVAWGVPLVARGERLEPVQFGPRLSIICRDVEMCGMGTSVEPSLIGAADD